MKSMSVFRFLSGGTLLVLVAGCAGAQTRVDLRTQSSDVDFSAAASTKPFQTGTVLPGTCARGQIFFKSDATAGQNIFECAAPNNWTQQLNTGGTFTAPNNSLVVGGTSGNTTLDVSTSYLNGLYPQLGASNTFGAFENIFVPSATTPALRIVGGAIPTVNPHVAGEWMTSPAGRALWGDGVNDQYAVSIAGSGITPPTAPITGHLAVWAPGYVVTDGGPVTPVAGGSAPSISGCSATIGTASANTVGFYTSGTTGACTVTLTFATTAPTGWVCASSDETAGNLSRQTGYTTTTATLQGTTVTGDSVTFSCRGF
jgi:hypothetical protein